jgi:hypothetical protein
MAPSNFVAQSASLAALLRRSGLGMFAGEFDERYKLAVLGNGESIEFNKACLANAEPPGCARRSPESVSVM